MGCLSRFLTVYRLFMEIDKEIVGANLIVSPNERIENDNSLHLQTLVLQEVGEHPEANLVIDLASVPFMSSAGLRVFLIVAKTLRENGKSFALCGLKPLVQDIFQLAGFDKVIDIYPDRDSTPFLASDNEISE